LVWGVSRENDSTFFIPRSSLPPFPSPVLFDPFYVLTFPHLEGSHPNFYSPPLLDAFGNISFYVEFSFIHLESSHKRSKHAATVLSFFPVFELPRLGSSNSNQGDLCCSYTLSGFLVGALTDPSGKRVIAMPILPAPPLSLTFFPLTKIDLVLIRFPFFF